jgi:hypothetical protein
VPRRRMAAHSEHADATLLFRRDSLRTNAMAVIAETVRPAQMGAQTGAAGIALRFVCCSPTVGALASNHRRARRFERSPVVFGRDSSARSVR